MAVTNSTSSSAATAATSLIPIDDEKLVVSQVQSALRRKDFSKVESILSGLNGKDAASKILWRPIRSGMTCMHIATRCMLSEQYYGGCGNDKDWWRWILDRASPSDGFGEARDRSGETCFDVFFATWLNPPIGASCGFRNFEASLETVLEGNNDHLRSLRDWVLRQLPNQPSHHQRHCSALIFPTNKHEQVVARFWRALELMCRAAAAVLGEDGTDCGDETRPFVSVLHVLARYNACPGPTVSRLVVSLFPEAARMAPLPLHLWVSGAPCSSSFSSSLRRHDRDGDGLLAPLLEAYPEAAGSLVKNCSSIRLGGSAGRYPLHVALYQGKPLRQVEHWVRAYPRILGVVDTAHSQLPTWALVALSMRHEQRRWSRNLQRRQPDVSLFDWLDSNNRVEQEQHDLECVHLDVLYGVVRALPQALSSLELLGPSSIVEEVHNIYEK